MATIKHGLYYANLDELEFVMKVTLLLVRSSHYIIAESLILIIIHW